MNLTARQEQLIQAICRGLRRKEIAVEFGVSESAVKRLIEKLCLRLNQNSMRGLAVAYLQAKRGVAIRPSVANSGAVRNWTQNETKNFTACETSSRR